MKPMQRIPMHYFMIHVQTTFIGPSGQMGMKMLPAIHASTKKQVPMIAIRTAQDTAASQLVHFGIDPAGIKDASITGVSYLGLMTEAEFEAGLNGPDLQREPTQAPTADPENPFTN